MAGGWDRKLKTLCSTGPHSTSAWFLEEEQQFPLIRKIRWTKMTQTHQGALRK